MSTLNSSASTFRLNHLSTLATTSSLPHELILPTLTLILFIYFFVLVKKASKFYCHCSGRLLKLNCTGFSFPLPKFHDPLPCHVNGKEYYYVETRKPRFQIHKEAQFPFLNTQYEFEGHYICTAPVTSK